MLVPQLHLHCDSIHLQFHCTNAQLQLTRDASNTDMAVALKHMGSLFQHASYDLFAGCDPFQSFIRVLLHKYDEDTPHDILDSDTDTAPPYHNNIIHTRAHRSITTSVTDWNRLRPHMAADSPDLLTYIYGLVSSLPPSN